MSAWHNQRARLPGNPEILGDFSSRFSNIMSDIYYVAAELFRGAPVTKSSQ
jgi:hypothetical protein